MNLSKLSSTVLCVLLQLCSLQLLVVAMPTCRLLEDVVLNTHHLLRDLGGAFPVQCLKYNINISFPDSAFPASTANHPQCRQALWVVYETLRETQLLFEDFELPVGEGGVSWDRKKLSSFQNLQDRLLEEGSCVSITEYSDFKLDQSVHQQDSRCGSAACGWMALRRDVLWVLKTALREHHSCFTRRGRH
uniref:Interferon alpha-4-like n=1 Tax=Echeneis naucrates TaxID=173247 RepID=A0A665WLJ9_ECHNA